MSAREGGAGMLFQLTAQRHTIGERIDEAIKTVLNHGQYILGPEVSLLEERLAAFCGAKHCIACANGTDALQLVLMAEGLGKGDAVFVPAFTFVATAGAVALVGATPVFVDVARDSFLMDAASLEAAIGEAKRLGLTPRGIIAVDLFGQPADYPALRKIAETHSLTLLADAAQSFGASLNGKAVGTLAAYTTTSFYPTKPLSCMGDGGAIFTDDDAATKLLRSLRVHGHDDQRQSLRVGLNSRLDSIQAAILLEKLQVFPREILARQAIADRYNALIGDIVQTQKIMPDASSVWAQYTILTKKRDQIAAACREAGIPTFIYYARPLHFEAGYRDCPASPTGLSNCEWLSQSAISLPLNAYLSEEAVDLVARTVKTALGH